MPLPTFFAEWIVSAGINKSSPALRVTATEKSFSKRKTEKRKEEHSAARVDGAPKGTRNKLWTVCAGGVFMPNVLVARKGA